MLADFEGNDPYLLNDIAADIYAIEDEARLETVKRVRLQAGATGIITLHELHRILDEVGVAGLTEERTT